MTSKGWITALIGATTLGIVSPMLIEQASNPCHALEKAALKYIDGDYAIFGQALGGWAVDSFSRGKLAEAAVRSTNTRVPPQVACLAKYYDVVWGDGKMIDFN